MQINLHVYNPEWTSTFAICKTELLDLIGTVEPRIEHIGSTSVEGLSAKPIIDILVGVKDESNLESFILPLLAANYVYYEKFNRSMPYRRFFVKHKLPPQQLSIPPVITDSDEIPASSVEYNNRLAHIHILPYNSEHWVRHIAFRDYLRSHPTIRKRYQQLKEELSIKNWADGTEYNAAKNQFIKEAEAAAIAWYTELHP